jgi:hypothetical protein
MTINFFPFTVRGLGNQPGALIAPNPLDMLNQFDGIKLIQVHVDGVQTRDVQ